MRKSDPGELAAAYRDRGYAVVRGLFTPDEVAAVGRAIDQLHEEGLAHGRSFRHGNLFYNVAGSDAGPQVRMVQWPSYHQPVMNALRLDPRWVGVLEPFIGRDIKQIINQVHWKPRGVGAGGDWTWHQDSRFRRPVSAYSDLGSTYVQTGLAVDPHTRESGCLRFIPGSHRHGDLAMGIAGSVLGQALTDEPLASLGLDPATAVDLLLEPGDVALWSPYLVHASGENRSDHSRRLYINGYVRADACDRGEWAFRDGRPVPFGPEPALVHYEQLHERPEPHYIGLPGTG